MEHATIDFETYSEAGYVYNKAEQKWEGLLKWKRKSKAVSGLV